MPGSDVITVKNLELKRDAAVFTFQTGDFAFYNEVNGKVTGAVFRGQGHLHITPPTPEERHNLSILNHTEEFDQDFDQVVLRFTDGTAADLHKAATERRTLMQTSQRQRRDSRDLRGINCMTISICVCCRTFSARRRAASFWRPFMAKATRISSSNMTLKAWAFLLRKKCRSSVRPTGAKLTCSRFIALKSMPTAFPRETERNATYSISREDLDTSIEKSGFLTGTATTEIHADQDGVAVVPLNLYPTLRVSKVETASGTPLDYVQEKKDDDPDFGVILQHPLKKDESVSLKIYYGGKEVVENEGNSNYYPIARESWYPNATQGLGNYASYHMLFHVPKGLQLIATGDKVNESTDGKITTSEWKTDVPLPVAGFNLGDFTMEEGSVQYKTGGSLSVDAFANTNPPDIFNAIADAVNNAPIAGGDDAPAGQIGRINTVSMLHMQLSEAQIAAQLYTQYFGALPFSHIAVTQQFACNYGQSWPMLVYLPICGFLDSTQQHVLGLRPEDMYWKMVTPHEVAHQWWGHTVGFRSYRDQWMSEGFADESASIFLLHTRPKVNDYLDFWKQERKMLTEKNSMGFRPIDVGPVTMGYRLDTQKTGFGVTRALIYPKGAFILHMVQMMMWSPQEGDRVFMETMHDFVSTYRLQPATTEDFKAIVEKHMTPAMDLDHNHKMDWFFNEYVYGTDLPTYHFEAQATPNDNGMSLHFRLVQSGVPAGFKMLIPIYVEFADGKVMKLGNATIVGDSEAEKTVQLPKLTTAIKKISINYYYDVLCAEN